MSLPTLPKFVYGTTRLGDSSISTEARVEIAKKAMEQTDWFHTSDQYGDALDILKTAFGPTPKPSTFVKVGWNDVDQIRGQITNQATRMGRSKVNIGQLCLGGDLAEALRNNGPELDALLALKDEGIVDHYVLEVFPWTSEVPLAALQGGHLSKLVDGLIFYLNPLQRFATNELWDKIVATSTPVVAMRTVAGGSLQRLLDPATDAPEWLKSRAVELAPVAAQISTKSWTEFCVRFAYSFPFVKTTVGSTARIENLGDFVHADNTPLPSDIIDQIQVLQRRWSDDVDRHAEPWTM